MTNRRRCLLAAGALAAFLLAQAGVGHAARAEDLSKASSAATPWTNLGIGGGGAFFYASGSPFDPNLLFVSSDMGQVFRSTDAGRNWRMLDWRNSPHVKWPVFHPTNPDIVYSCAIAGGTLRRSADKGCSGRRSEARTHPGRARTC